MKCAVVQPTKPYLKKTLHYFTYRIAAYNNLLASKHHKNTQEHCLTIQWRHTKGRKTLHRCSLKIKDKQEESLSERERISSSGQMLAATFGMVLNCHMIQVMSSTHFSLGLLLMKKAIPIKHPRVTGQIN